MLFDSVYSEKRTHGPLMKAWRVMRTSQLTMIGFYGVFILLVLCIAGRWLAPYALDQQFFGYQLIAPSWDNYGSVSFFLGTDDLGRDILSRLLHGVAPTFGSALIVTFAAIIPATLIGVFTGVKRGFRSSFLLHLFDILLSIPSLLLAIIVVAFIGPSLEHAMLAIWLSILPHSVHAIYAAVHNEYEKEYVIAARLDGATTWIILWEGILPNIKAQLVTEITRALSIAILDIAALGFLDLGARLPSPEWGAMLGDSLELLYIAPWSVMLPGAAILISVLLVNLLGDGIRRAIRVENQ